LSLETVELAVASRTAARGAGEHAVFVALLWPRPAIARKLTTCVVKIENGTADLREADWSRRILFKEIVEGPVGIDVRVTDRLAGGSGAFLDFLGATLLKALGGEAGDLASGAASELLEAPFAYAAKGLSAAEQETQRPLAAGSTTLIVDDSWPVDEVRTVPIALTSPHDITRVTRTRRQGVPAARKRTLLKAGSPNGAMVISARVYR